MTRNRSLYLVLWKILHHRRKCTVTTSSLRRTAVVHCLDSLQKVVLKSYQEYSRTIQDSSENLRAMSASETNKCEAELIVDNALLVSGRQEDPLASDSNASVSFSASDPNDDDKTVDSTLTIEKEAAQKPNTDEDDGPKLAEPASISPHETIQQGPEPQESEQEPMFPATQFMTARKAISTKRKSPPTLVGFKAKRTNARKTMAHEWSDAVARPWSVSPNDPQEMQDEEDSDSSSKTELFRMSLNASDGNEATSKEINNMKADGKEVQEEEHAGRLATVSTEEDTEDDPGSPEQMEAEDYTSSSGEEDAGDEDYVATVASVCKQEMSTTCKNDAPVASKKSGRGRGRPRKHPEDPNRAFVDNTPVDIGTVVFSKW